MDRIQDGSKVSLDNDDDAGGNMGSKAAQLD